MNDPTGVAAHRTIPIDERLARRSDIAARRVREPEPVASSGQLQIDRQNRTE
jgi:hypothetical protein